jgi:GNAT superfamily N-acetyltransferase
MEIRGMIEVRPVTDRRTRRQFVDLPYRTFRRHPHWIPPARLTEVPQFDPKRNPFFTGADMDLFLAWDGDRLAGRIAAIDDHRHNETYRDNLAGFGFFEADSAEAASALLAEVERWAAARGRTSIRGPVSPSLNHVAGLQIDAYDTDPFVMMPWNPPEYVGFVEAAGYRKAKDLLCWLLQVDRSPMARLELIARRAQQRHDIVVRPVNRWRLRSESDRLYEIYLSAWERNWGFVPPSADEFWHIVKDLQWLRKLDGLLIAEVDGHPVGATTSVPDVNQVLKGTNGRLMPVLWWRLLNMSRIITRTRAVTTGVVKEYQEKGVLAVLMYHLLRSASRNGFTEVEFSWILENNTLANQSLEKAGAQMYKTYRLYEKAVGTAGSGRRTAGS